jgi:excisionase family DNA binding protein
MSLATDGTATGVADLGHPGTQGNSETTDALLALPTVARQLAVSTRTIRRLIAAGELPQPVKVGRVSRWFTTDVSGYLARLRAERK